MTGHELTADGVTVTFGGRRVLDDVGLTVRTGDVVGVTGPSGCGKTTLVRVLAGLVPPESGEVRYDGASKAARGAVAMLAQHPRQVCNPRWTLGQIISEPAAIRREPVVIDDVATRVGLDHQLIDRYPGQVSDGQLQRACIARLLVQRAVFVLCDEPTAMLDPIAAGDVTALLRDIAQTAAVVLVSHDPAVVAALSDTVVPLPG